MAADAALTKISSSPFKLRYQGNLALAQFGVRTLAQMIADCEPGPLKTYLQSLPPNQGISNSIGNDLTVRVSNEDPTAQPPTPNGGTFGAIALDPAGGVGGGVRVACSLACANLIVEVKREHSIAR